MGYKTVHRVLCTVYTFVGSGLGLGILFTCHVAPLESATGLGAGTFKEPTAQRLESIGKEISTVCDH